MTKPGIFIAIDGPDGAGKTTLVQKVTDLMMRFFSDYHLFESTTAFKGGSVGKAFYQRMKERPMSELTEILGMALSLSETGDDFVKPKLEESTVIIMDRWLSSFYAYQYCGRNRSITYSLYQELISLPVPDLYIYCDVKPEIALGRMKHRNDNSYLDDETLAFKNKVSAGYQTFFLQMSTQRQNVLMLDCNKPLEDVYQQLEVGLKQFAEKRNHSIIT